MKRNREQSQRLIQFWILSLLFVTLSMLLSAWTTSYSHTNHNRETTVNAVVQLMEDQYARGLSLDDMRPWLPDLLNGIKAKQMILYRGESVEFQWQPKGVYEVATMHYRRDLNNGLKMNLVLTRTPLVPAFSSQEWLLVAIGLVAALGMVWFGRGWLEREMSGIELLALRASRINGGDVEAAGELVKGERPLSVSRALRKLHRNWQQEREAKLELDRQIRTRAFIDHETELGNRMFFERRLAALAPNHRFRNQGVLCLLQFAGLEEVEPARRLPVLKAFIEHCQPILQEHPDAVFARLNWLQLALVIPMLPLKEADQLAVKLHRIGARLPLPEGAVKSELLNIGLAYFSREEPLEQAQEEAEQALRAAQLQGESSWFMYDKGAVDRELAQGSVRWRSLIENALTQKRFVTLFQPVLDENGAVLCREMFSRIRDGQGKILRASLYRPMARRCGLIPRVDRELLALALQQMQAHGWQQPLVVNLACESVLHPRFAKSFIMLLANYHIRRTQLVIEVNERELVQNAERMIPVLKELKRTGIQLSIDGVGYTVEGTHYIERLPVEWIKLHPSLVHQVEHRPESQLVITSLTQALSNRGLTILAEGVESAEEGRCLLQLGVDGVQGRHYGEAAPTTE
ncbi:EAL domain-containing protein [Ferrimonas marina]|uniref:RNase E specificity factor CsrD n=1 Tax=Ferrimonas marina TaxID=299255 RepID=A0A1M5Y0I9_9GAMM|nr:EAL domain-containing protein [Ferrimonas marina]SHI05459.1 RNase E specificity factor CsrD [Ferrimonas marina]